MADSDKPIATVLGAGVIGRSWIRVFSRAGWETRVYDVDPDRRARALEWARRSAREDGRAHGREAEGRDAETLVACESLAAALSGSVWVQESGPEDLDIKRRIFAELDEAADRATILASSTSAMDMTRIAEGLPGARRCIVAHPVNPPHVVPVVEVLPGRETDTSVVEQTMEVLRRVGQTPVLLRRFVPGFLLNRMQAALIREAVSLLASGVASADDIDAVVRDGLGLRWALMGPFATGHTNADAGAGAYYRMYGSAYRALWEDLDPDPALSDAVIDQIHDGVEARYGPDQVAALGAWRDRMIRRIRDLKTDDPPPSAG